MNSLRKTALVAGVMYLITFISIPTLSLYGPVRDDPNYILGPGPDTPILIGAVLEVVVASACIGTAVALYQVVKRQHEGVALGFVGARVLEAAMIFAGVVSLLTVVTLRQSESGADALAGRWRPACDVITNDSAAGVSSAAPAPWAPRAVRCTSGPGCPIGTWRNCSLFVEARGGVIWTSLGYYDLVVAWHDGATTQQPNRGPFGRRGGRGGRGRDLHGVVDVPGDC